MVIGWVEVRKKKSRAAEQASLPNFILQTRAGGGGRARPSGTRAGTWTIDRAQLVRAGQMSRRAARGWGRGLCRPRTGVGRGDETHLPRQELLHKIVPAVIEEADEAMLRVIHPSLRGSLNTGNETQCSGMIRRCGPLSLVLGPGASSRAKGLAPVA